MDNVTAIISALGGTSQLAQALQIAPTTVSSWKASGRIPPWRLEKIKTIAEQRGVQLPIC